jgi:hypothetical protein
VPFASGVPAVVLRVPMAKMCRACSCGPVPVEMSGRVTEETLLPGSRGTEKA